MKEAAMRWSGLALVFALLLSACQAGLDRPRPISAEAVQAPEWQEIAAAEDVDHIARSGAAWAEGLRAARADGFARRIAAEGSLLDPQAALPRPAPTPGTYLCRLVKLGGRGR